MRFMEPLISLFPECANADGTDGCKDIVASE
jgi:hypothetical protein